MVRDVDDIPDLTSQQKDSLHDVARGCRNVLEQLKETLDKFQDMDSNTNGISAKSRRVWKRLQWDQKDIDEFRHRIALNITAFGTFLNQITR